jgi:hypothetical protein
MHELIQRLTNVSFSDSDTWTFERASRERGRRLGSLAGGAAESGVGSESRSERARFMVRSKYRGSWRAKAAKHRGPFRG